MKNLFKLPLSFLVVLVIISTGLFINSVKATNTFTGWWTVEVTIVYINGEPQIKSECLEIPGTSCNMPGSIHYIEAPW